MTKAEALEIADEMGLEFLKDSDLQEEFLIGATVQNLINWNHDIRSEIMSERAECSCRSAYMGEDA